MEGTEIQSDAEKVLESWKIFNFNEKRVLYDQQCLELKEAKMNSINGRKKLNEATKLFRSKTKLEQADSIQEILKAYQDEIDQLSRRSKASELAFFNLYKSLSDCLDPIPIIENLLTTKAQVASQNYEIQRLRSELTQYDLEFQQLKNQDVTIRRLENQINDYKETLEEKVNEEVQRITEEIEASCELRINEIKEHLRSTERLLHSSNETIKLAHDTTEKYQLQLLNISSQTDERISSLQVENTLLTETTERLRAYIAELENDLLQLKSTSTTSTSNHSTSTSGHINPTLPLPLPSSSSSSSSSCQDDKLQSYNEIILQLKHELLLKDELILKEKLKYEIIMKDSYNENEKLKNEKNNLLKELQQRPQQKEYNELKKQLNIIQNVLFHTENEEIDDYNYPTSTVMNMTTSTSTTPGNGTSTDSIEDHPIDPSSNTQNINEIGVKGSSSTSKGLMKLESMLVARLKNLEHELTENRVVLENLRQSEEFARKRVSELEKSLLESQLLISQLEKDLENHVLNTSTAVLLHSGKNNSRTKERESSSSSSSSSTTMIDPSLVQLLTDSDNYNLETSRFLKNEFPNNSQRTENSTVAGQQQMISILQAQRDRYKERLENMESLRQATQNKLTESERIREKLEADNVELYTKLRYSQGHNNDHQRTGRGSSHYHDLEASHPTSLHLNLQSKYEQKLNPLTILTQLERQKRHQDLTLPERILLNTTVTCVSTQMGRSILASYVIAMHLLVFFTLYYMAHHHSGCDYSSTSNIISPENPHS